MTTFTYYRPFSSDEPAPLGFVAPSLDDARETARLAALAVAAKRRARAHAVIDRDMHQQDKARIADAIARRPDGFWNGAARYGTQFAADMLESQVSRHLIRRCRARLRMGST